jgi:hypothetical protein
VAFLNTYSEIVNGERVWDENSFSFFCNTELDSEEKRRVLLQEMSSIKGFKGVPPNSLHHTRKGSETFYESDTFMGRY